MASTLDKHRLPEVFEGLKDNLHKLTAWEIDRLEEWEVLVERGKELSEKQMDCLERMWQKV